MTFRALLGNSFTITQILLQSDRIYLEIRIPTLDYSPKLHTSPSVSAEQITAWVRRMPCRTGYILAYLLLPLTALGLGALGREEERKEISFSPLELALL